MPSSVLRLVCCTRHLTRTRDQRGNVLQVAGQVWWHGHVHELISNKLMGWALTVANLGCITFRNRGLMYPRGEASFCCWSATEKIHWASLKRQKLWICNWRINNFNASTLPWSVLLTLQTQSKSVQQNPKRQNSWRLMRCLDYNRN